MNSWDKEEAQYLILLEDIIDSYQKNFVDVVDNPGYAYQGNQDEYHMVFRDQGVNAILFKFSYQSNPGFFPQNVLIDFETSKNNQMYSYRQ